MRRDATRCDATRRTTGDGRRAGLALKTPETIPFRLTRDMVDGMGAAGCEGANNFSPLSPLGGRRRQRPPLAPRTACPHCLPALLPPVSGVFQRCCEETLTVLRRHGTELLSILSVVVHDPLYGRGLPLPLPQSQSLRYSLFDRVSVFVQWATLCDCRRRRG